MDWKEAGIILHNMRKSIFAYVRSAHPRDGHDENENLTSEVVLLILQNMHRWDLEHMSQDDVRQKIILMTKRRLKDAERRMYGDKRDNATEDFDRTKVMRRSISLNEKLDHAGLLEQHGKEYLSLSPHAPETIDHDIELTLSDLKEFIPANEYRVLLLSTAGYSEVEIAHFLGKTGSRISQLLSNARERIAWKLKDHYLQVQPRHASPPKRGNQFPKRPVNTKKITKYMMPHRRLRKNR